VEEDYSIIRGREVVQGPRGGEVLEKRQGSESWAWRWLEV
jgi:hypothetical protein